MWESEVLSRGRTVMVVVVMVVVDDHGDRGRFEKRERISDVFESRVHCLAVQPRALL
jgi:hypothetical protein